MGKYDESIANILNTEVEGIRKLTDTLDRDVMQRIIDLLLTVKKNGKKVITAGCGTSGATAIRVAHSLNVCEVPSFFLDPCMSIHGGCGAIQEGDIVVLFSKGGNTPEITNYIPIAREKKAVVIGAGAAGRYLLQGADRPRVRPVRYVRLGQLHGLLRRVGRHCLYHHALQRLHEG